jgi:hypothetical protein
MASSKRIGASVLAAAAVALSIFGVVLAATDPNPAGISGQALTLNGYPPKTVDMQLTITSNGGSSILADAKIDFQKQLMQISFDIPSAFSSTPVQIVLTNSDLYVGSQGLVSLAGKPWISEVLTTNPPFFGLSLEMTKPDVALITSYRRLLTQRDGEYTTYNFGRGMVLRPLTNGEIKKPVSGSMNFSITTGKEGQVTAANVTFSSPSHSISVTSKILSYNQPVKVTIPPASQVASNQQTLITSLWNALPVAEILSPTNLFQPAGITVN